MKSKSSQAPTKAEVIRMSRMAEAGCLACKQLGYYRQGQVHHILSGGNRIRNGYGTEHRYTICLCPWHHMGQTDHEYTTVQMEHMLGPSLALDKPAFEKRFGNEWDLLDTQDKLLGT